MGAKGIRKRKPGTPLPKAQDGAGKSAGGWELQHSPYTFEGMMEGLARLGRAGGSAPPAARAVMALVVAVLALGMVTAVLQWLI